MVNLPQSPIWKTKDQIEKELWELYERFFTWKNNVIWLQVRSLVVKYYYNQLNHLEIKNQTKETISLLDQIKITNKNSSDIGTIWSKRAFRAALLSLFLSIWAIIFSFLDFKWDQDRQDDQIELLKNIENWISNLSFQKEDD